MKSTILPRSSPAGLRTSAVDKTLAEIGRTRALLVAVTDSSVARHIPTALAAGNGRSCALRAQSLRWGCQKLPLRTGCGMQLARRTAGEVHAQHVGGMAEHERGAVRGRARGL